jgi:hypothetical protein
VFNFSIETRDGRDGQDEMGIRPARVPHFMDVSRGTHRVSMALAIFSQHPSTLVYHNHLQTNNLDMRGTFS